MKRLALWTLTALLLAALTVGAWFSVLRRPRPVVPVAGADRGRAECITRALAKVRRRLGNVAPRRSVVQLMDRLRDSNGLNDTGFLFPLEDVWAVRSDQSLLEPLHPGYVTAVEAIVDLHRQLAGREVDLIVLPVPSHVQLYAHRLLSDVSADQTVWPAYFRAVEHLLSEGVEVLDVLDELRSYDGPGDVLNRYDHHWDWPGAEIGADLLAARLRGRYPRIRTAADYAHFATTLTHRTTPKHLFIRNGIVPDESHPYPEGLQEEHLMQRVWYRGDVCPWPRNIESPVLVVGDSSAHFYGNRGFSFTQHLSKKLGFLVDDRSRAGWAYRVADQIATDLWPRPGTQVVVLVIRAANLTPHRRRSWSLAGRAFRRASFRLPPGQVTVKAVAVETPQAPDPRTAAYPNALGTFAWKVLEVEEGQLAGSSLIARDWLMKVRKRTAAASIRPGQTARLTVIPWGLALRQTPGLDKVEAIDTVSDFDSPRYWTLSVKKVKHNGREK
ncbi:MAG: alginate O-acetyltransferase AlgX-related protein [Phycisphaerae bacterium]